MRSDLLLFVWIGVIIVITFFVAFLFGRVYNRFIIKPTKEGKKDQTSYKFLKHAITAIIYIVGFSWAAFKIDALRTIASSLLAGAGILAIVVGFASQHTLANIISGVFIVLFKPFHVNDRIVIRDNLAGVVEDITLRHVVIRDYENRRIIIPNSIISDEVIVNADIEDSRICKFIDIGISYGSDIDLAREIMMEEIASHPLHIDGRNEEQIERGVELVPVKVIALGEYSVTLRAWAWSIDFFSSRVLYWEVLESVKKRFDKEGIEIPFPYRTLIHRGAENIFMEKDRPGKEEETS